MAKKIKVLLIQNDSKLGQKGDLLEVSVGYARNYLIPNKIAIPATKNALEQKAKLEKQKQETKNKEEALLEPILNKIKAEGIEFVCHANENGQLFGSINPDTIRKSLTEKFGLTIEKDTKVNLEITGEEKDLTHIRHLGSYTGIISFPGFSDSLKTHFSIAVKPLTR